MKKTDPIILNKRAEEIFVLKNMEALKYTLVVPIEGGFPNTSFHDFNKSLSTNSVFSTCLSTFRFLVTVGAGGVVCALLPDDAPPISSMSAMSLLSSIT